MFLLLGFNPYLIFILVFVYIYLDLYYTKNKVPYFRLLHVSLLFVLFLTGAEAVKINEFFVWYTPVIAVVILMSILFNDLHLSFITALTISLFSSNRFEYVLIFMVTGIIASLLSKNLTTLKSIIRTFLLCGVIQVVLVFLLSNFSIERHMLTEYMHIMLSAGIYGMLLLGFIGFGVIHLLEYLFNIITNMSLVELADYNNPILKKLSLIAPGTYHHSLMVGNLSDAASEKIGANSLLARVGAYYHDIGKLDKPEYFAENQLMQFSKHENLTPSISKMVITNHVRQGVELANNYKLNKRIIDFIQEHHGTSIVFYFYMRALEEQQENIPGEEEFRYPGPKPRSKETAIVLLADSVEAATRTLDEPQPGKIEELVHKIINNKFIDGQLDQCDLTLKNLEQIGQTFTRMLTSIYHSRIQYPEEKQNANPKKSTEKNSSAAKKDNTKYRNNK